MYVCLCRSELVAVLAHSKAVVKKPEISDSAVDRLVSEENAVEFGRLMAKGGAEVRPQGGYEFPIKEDGRWHKECLRKATDGLEEKERERWGRTLGSAVSQLLQTRGGKRILPSASPTPRSKHPRPSIPTTRKKHAHQARPAQHTPASAAPARPTSATAGASPAQPTSSSTAPATHSPDAHTPRLQDAPSADHAPVRSAAPEGDTPVNPSTQLFADRMVQVFGVSERAVLEDTTVRATQTEDPMTANALTFSAAVERERRLTNEKREDREAMMEWLQESNRLRNEITRLREVVGRLEEDHDRLVQKMADYLYRGLR
jgi:hypothetical protein